MGRLVVSAALLGFILTLAGCGSSNGPTTGPQGAAPKEQAETDDLMAKGVQQSNKRGR
jgi:hypothetical protein